MVDVNLPSTVPTAIYDLSYNLESSDELIIEPRSILHQEKHRAKTLQHHLPHPPRKRPRTSLLLALPRPLHPRIQEPLCRSPVRPLRPRRHLRRSPVDSGMDQTESISGSNPPERRSPTAARTHLALQIRHPALQPRPAGDASL